MTFDVLLLLWASVMMLLLLQYLSIADPRSLLLTCCCLCVTIAIAIVGSRSSCSCCCCAPGSRSSCSCCCCGVPIAIVIVGSCSGCTWREACVDNALDRGRINVVDGAKGLLPVRVLLLCCLHVTIATPVIVGLRSGCGCFCCSGVPVAFGGKDVMVTKMLIENLLLLLIEDR